MMNPIRNVERAPGPGGPAVKGGLRAHHNYPMQRKPRLKFDEGGPMEEDPTAPPEGAGLDPADLKAGENLSPHDEGLREIVVDAMAAIRGQHPDPEEAIRDFVDLFGMKEFEELRRMVLAQGDGEEGEEEGPGEPEPDEQDDATAAPVEEEPQQGMQVGGLLHGPGTGQSDEIEAATPSGRKVLLSDGEYVIDAPTVAAIGDGSTAAGARRLDDMRKQIRQQTYGNEKQAKPMKDGGMLVALEG